MIAYIYLNNPNPPNDPYNHIIIDYYILTNTESTVYEPRTVEVENKLLTPLKPEF